MDNIKEEYIESIIQRDKVLAETENDKEDEVVEESGDELETEVSTESQD